MSYVDAYMVAVPIDKKPEFQAHATIMAELFVEFGALQAMDNWGDNIPFGQTTCMNSAVQKKDNETVVMGWVIWPSKDIRDAGMSKAMTDPRMSVHKPVFDGARLIYGGFENIVKR